jgi:uncharacterized protein (TIGR02646 family)
VKFIAVAVPPNLPKGWSKIYSGRVNALAGKATQEARAAYLRKHASWVRLKKWLSELSIEKCWYCEAHSRRSPFDVDHFRPKLGITVDGQPLPNDFGYYWMAYEWWNFRLSCQRCNRPENIDRVTRRGKWNEFPIQSENARCTPTVITVNQEAPRFLDPCIQADCELLAHGIDGEVRPSSAPGTWEYERARYTIDQLGLNDWNVPEDRKKDWQGLSLLLKYAGSAPPADVAAHVSRYLDDDQEYSCFFRSAIGTHRDKQWIEALL